MNKANLKTYVFIILSLLTTGTMLSSCSKNDNNNPSGPTNPDPGPTFKPSDFKLTITEIQKSQSTYRIAFEVSNLKNEAFGDQPEDGSYGIRFKVKTTDGAQYQSSTSVKDMSAKGSATDFCTIDFTSGKIVDEATLSYEYYEN